MERERTLDGQLRNVGVYTTNGPDPGWSAEERELRRKQNRWGGILRSEQENLVKLLNRQEDEKDPAQLARLKVRRGQIEQQIERAENELASLEIVN